MGDPAAPPAADSSAGLTAETSIGREPDRKTRTAPMTATSATSTVMFRRRFVRGPRLPDSGSRNDSRSRVRSLTGALQGSTWQSGLSHV